MSGTKAGGLKTVATNKLRHGEDFYKRIGAKGGRNGHTGGFAANRDLAVVAGAKGGRKSRRGDAKEWWDKNKSSVVILLKQGYTYEQIGNKLGVAGSKVFYANNKYGDK